MKLNFACGKQTWSDYYCVDAVQHPKATRPLDLQHAFTFAEDGQVLNPLPLDDASCSEVCAFHFIEHVWEWEAQYVLFEFKRLLEPGGKLILELPDIKKAAQNLIDGSSDQMCMWPLYGDPGHKDPFMCHRYGYMPETIEKLLLACGFKSVVHMKPQTHGKRANRDMRVECIK